MRAGDWTLKDAALALALPLALVVTLWAGLHPFSWARPNEVRWLRGGDGLSFGRDSMALTEDEFHWDTADGPAEMGWELWLKAAGPTAAPKAIVVLVDEARMPALLLSQSGVAAVLAARVTNADGERWYNDFVFPGVFAGGGVHHLTLTSGTPRPRLYVNGREVVASAGYGIPLARQGMPLRGPLLLGCRPRASGSWQGELYGLVLHARPPTHREPGGKGLSQAVAEKARSPGILGAYAFLEGQGEIVRDLTGRGPALHIPPYYRPVGVQVLSAQPPLVWWNRHVVLDMAINLIGFLPLGFLLAWTFGRNRPKHRGALLLLVTSAGAILSVGIEATQVLMPTRDSSLLDLLLNTVGTGLGAGLALWLTVRQSRPRVVLREPTL